MKDSLDDDPLHDSDAALKPILQAAQESSTSANFSTLLALVSKALSHTDVFAGYDQLKAILQEPLRKTAPDADKANKALQTLDLFSHGTYVDYVSRGETHFLTLSDSQIFKLRQLTVLSLVQTACLEKSGHLSYATVQAALQLGSSTAAADTKTTTPIVSPGALAAQNYRAVEQILISCVYAGVVSGRLCQKTQSLRFTTGRFVSRDVPTAAAPQLLQTVRQLRGRLQQAQRYLNQAQTAVNESLQKDEQYWKRVSQRAEMSLSAGGAGGRGGAAASVADTWSAAMVGHAGLLSSTTAEVTSAAAAMDVTGRRQKRSRGGLSSGTAAGGASAFQL